MMGLTYNVVPAAKRRIRLVVIATAAGTLCACGASGSSHITASSAASSGELGSAPPARSQSTGPGATPPSSNDSSQPAAAGSSPAGPRYFELNQQFSGFNSGTTDVTASEEQSAYAHVLFGISPGGTSQVIDGNLSATPVPANVTANSDGCTSIGYSEQTSSATVQFSGTLNNGTMQATVNVSVIGGDVVDNTEYLGASSGTVTFSTPISMVSLDDIPDPPTGGTCAYSSDYGVDASWTPPAQGAAVSGYDIYELVSAVNPPLFDIGHISQADMDDESATTHAHDADVLSYLIYSIGPTGLDSLTPLTLTFSSIAAGILGPNPEASCSGS
jgi:hypothetical protein